MPAENEPLDAVPQIPAQDQSAPSDPSGQSTTAPVDADAFPVARAYLANTPGPITAPLGSKDRIDLLDALRGFALLGILLVNIPGFAFSLYDTTEFNHPWTGALNDWVNLIVHMLADSKFYTLFSFLFGYGFALQVLRFRASDDEFLAKYLRRFTTLLIIGIAHAILFWWGDILVLYSLLGFLLLPMRKWSNRALLITAITITTLFILGAALYTYWTYFLFPPGEPEYDLTQILADMSTKAAAAYGQGDFGASMQQRISDWIIVLFVINTYLAPAVLVTFILGMLAARIDLLTSYRFTHQFWRRVFVICFFVAVPIQLVYSIYQFQTFSEPPPLTMSVSGYFSTLSAPLLTLAYIAIFILARQAKSWRTCIEKPLTYVGRMALTNYLMQSVIASFIFNGYGLGYFAKLDPATIRLIAVGIFLIQIPLSMLWLSIFNYGPFEYLWRAATYLRFPPMLRTTPHVK